MKILLIGYIGTLFFFCSDAAVSRGILVGVDYYPEQWPSDKMQADMKSIKEDLGADIIRIGEFMWNSIEPSDGSFNFTLLDSILDAAKTNNLKVMLGTPTATMPAWLYSGHKADIAQVAPDSPNGYAGTRAEFGGRRQYSFNSDTYLQYANRLVKQLADRYNMNEIIESWQIDNELGHEGSDIDFSDITLSAWRTWLQTKYTSITGLNTAWGTMFWGVTYGAFSQVPLPLYTIPGTGGNSNEAFRSNMSPGMLLDYRRFRAEAIANFAISQVQTLRDSYSTSMSTVPLRITTNSPGGFWGKAMDSNLFFSQMDFVSYDNYPVWGGSLAPSDPSSVALSLDTVRGWGAYSAGSFAGYTITEQLIGAQGHDIIGYTPRPNQTVAWSAQTLTHGGNSVMFFRYRAAVFGQEEYCYGVLDQTTPMASGRKWNEALKVFSLSRQYEALWLAPVRARVALIYDMDNIFSWQSQPQSTAFDFTNEAHRLYQPFWRNGICVDVFSANRTTEVHLERYDVVLLPAPLMITDSLWSALQSFVQNTGGSLWIGFRGDIKVPANNQMRTSPSRLADLAGVSVNEFESLNTGMPDVPLKRVSDGKAAVGSVWRDGLAITSTSDTAAIWAYDDAEFFGGLGYNAVTRRRFDRGGEVVYVGTGIDPELLVPLATETLISKGLVELNAKVTWPATVEVTHRTDQTGGSWTAMINFDSQPVVVGGVGLEPYGVDVSRTENAPTIAMTRSAARAGLKGSTFLGLTPVCIFALLYI